MPTPSGLPKSPGRMKPIEEKTYQTASVGWRTKDPDPGEASDFIIKILSKGLVVVVDLLATDGVDVVHGSGKPHGSSHIGSPSLVTMGGCLEAGPLKGDLLDHFPTSLVRRPGVHD